MNMEDERIRKRISYRMFRDFLDIMEKEPFKKAVLTRLFELLDAKHCFGSETMAMHARESLELLLKDREVA